MARGAARAALPDREGGRITPYASLFCGAFALGFAVAAPLGPTGATAIRHGLASGGMVAFWIGAGAALTDLAYILAVWGGLSPLLLRLPWLEPVLFALGALMLGRMGWGAVRGGIAGPFAAPQAGTAPEDHATARRAPRGWWSALLLGIGVTVVNPATITSWISVGGAFVTANLRGLPPLPAIGVMTGIMAGSIAWFGILAAAVGLARASLRRLPWLLRALGTVSGLILFGFALVFAWKALLACPWPLRPR